MSFLSKTLWLGAGGVALSVGFSAVAAGTLTWQAAGTGVQNAAWVAGKGFDIGGTVIEAGGEALVHLTSG